MDQAAATVLTRAKLYAHHLCLSHYGRYWAERVHMDAKQEAGVFESAYLQGYAQAIDDIVAHLEAGEALPGGPLYAWITGGAQGSTEPLRRNRNSR